MIEDKLRELLTEMSIPQDHIDTLDLEWLIVQLPARHKDHKNYKDAYSLTKELSFIQKRSEEND